jgi:hypothetical protein
VFRGFRGSHLEGIFGAFVIAKSDYKDRSSQRYNLKWTCVLGIRLSYRLRSLELLNRILGIKKSCRLNKNRIV